MFWIQLEVISPESWCMYFLQLRCIQSENFELLILWGLLFCWQLRGREGTEICFAKRLTTASLKALPSRGVHKRVLRGVCVGNWQPLNGASGSSCKSPSQCCFTLGEAYLSGGDQSNVCQRGSAQQGFPPRDLLSFEHHPLAPKQSRAHTLELMVALASSWISLWSPGRGALCCVCRSQLPAGARPHSARRGSRSPWRPAFAEEPKPGLAISFTYVFALLEPM